MRLSQLFTKTKREDPKDEESLNAKLLIRAGFVHKEMAGVYDFLPLGWRVARKIMQIIREEMEKIGGQELYLSALQNPEVWKATGRWSDEVVDVWFKTKLHTGTEVGLGTTHEEPLAFLMTHHISSYRDLPVAVFQFQTKFRNELRSKSGLLRTREFIMKDLYSFHATQEDLDEYYEKVKEAYECIFERVGIGESTFLTFASGGSFSRFSHEFQALCEAGEDIIYVHKEKKIAVNKEVYNEEVLRELGLKKEELEERKAIEVGNIFKLGTKFSEPAHLYYTTPTGARKPVIMGSYGIGIGRLMGTVVELWHDSEGIIWPESIAPYRVYLISQAENKKATLEAEKLYEKLQEKKIEVLYDDREEGMGVKLKDADLIGCPKRIVISEKTLERESVEIKDRKSGKIEMVYFSDLWKAL